MSGLIGWLHPNVLLKWILGFALAAYVSIPNYGLVAEATIPEDELARHNMLYVMPFVSARSVWSWENGSAVPGQKILTGVSGESPS